MTFKKHTPQRGLLIRHHHAEPARPAQGHQRRHHGRTHRCGSGFRSGSARHHFTGGKYYFSAGADLNEALAILAAADGLAYFKHWHWHRLCDVFVNLSKPGFAAIEDFCMTGGCEFAMACDSLSRAADGSGFGAGVRRLLGDDDLLLRGPQGGHLCIPRKATSQVQGQVRMMAVVRNRKEASALLLAGVRVLDFSQLLSGPWCTQKLGDLGVEVIKIEQPGTVNLNRHNPANYRNTSVYFNRVNRNKISPALDLSTPAGREVAHHLI